MKILHVSPSFYPAISYGGTIYSGLGLCTALARCGVDLHVLTTNANGLLTVLDVSTDQPVKLENGFQVRYCPRIFRHSVSPAMLSHLPSYVRWADVVHLTAVYSFPTLPTFGMCKVFNKPVVWSPRGALQRWEGSRRRTLKTIWERGCRALSPRGVILHATSDDEARESQDRFPGVDCVVIPNGIDIKEKVRHVPNQHKLRMLYLGRLHEKKGIENLLSACSLLKKNQVAAWTLTIAGAGEPRYAQSIQERISGLGLANQVTMVGAVVNEAKENLFEQADMSIVPSFTENFGMVVAESLAAAVPVIASTGTPWKRVEEVGCGLWVKNDPESLADAISRMSRMPLRDMGQRGRTWMLDEFSWDPIAGRMKRLYQDILDRAPS